ncbi:MULTISPECIES: dimethyl sulfoxide reductase anchor subunit family protein [Bacillus]|uniref:dimethyl sulfoxide reductase anchor subunit family protein n=1 Tax=Bacillus TaxID=1386 RepID=UPI0002DBD744|nr:MULTISPECIES: DmsC/YnfH family molybdoenzyme membrane anchor subunit [Bacillus]
MEHSMTLVFFTFLSQLAIGAFVAFFFLDVWKKNVSKKSGFISLVTILVFSVAAVIVSLFHLGHPFAAFRALLNIGDSWLTREIVFFPLFILLVFIYAFFAKSIGAKRLIGWITTCVGAITIFCTAMIYTIPAVPAWNNGTTMAAFFITALLTGPVFVQILVSFLEGKAVDFSKFTIGAVLLALLVNVINITIMKGSFAQAVETADLLMASPLFWLKMALLVVGLAAAVYSLIKTNIKSLTVVSVMFICFAVAEFVGRMLFYSTGVHL